MNIIQCTICKKPFQPLSGKVCNDCLRKLDEDFVTVRDYIYENKHASVDKVSEETGVSKQAILHLLKDGRLQIEDAAIGMLRCEVCKKPINTGRMCENCKKSLATKMDKSIGAGGKTPEQKKRDDQPLRGTAKLKN